MEYNSKDIEYMMRLKRSVYHGIAHLSPEQQNDIWEMVRKQVTMEDLRVYAINEIGRPVLFPAISCHRPVVVVFNRPPMDEELINLSKMMTKLNLHEDHLYVTQLQKVATESPNEYELLNKLLRSEIGIVAPQFIITYGCPLGEQAHIVQDYAGAKLVDSISLAFDEDPQSAVQQQRIVWEDTLRLFNKQGASSPTR